MRGRLLAPYAVVISIGAGLPAPSAPAGMRSRVQATPLSPANHVPVADAGGPYAGVRDRGVLLSATRSTDPDGDPLAFAWDFGDGSSASGPSPSHTYRVPGTYAARLLVSDGRGGLATATTHVLIAGASRARNHPPLAVHDGPYGGIVDHQMTFRASGTSDPDGDRLSYLWSFGDGTAAAGRTVTHTYGRAGTYTVRLLAVDGAGGASHATTAAVIAGAPRRADNQPPAARATGPEHAWPGQPVEFSASESSDPEGDDLAFAWTFDDGQGGGGAQVTHVFASGGRHVVKLLVSDSQGGVAAASLTIAVAGTEGNQLPVAVSGGPYAGLAGAPVIFHAGASRDPDGDDLMFAWDFGDDTTGSGPMPEHTYTTPGTYAVTLLVSDDNGGTVTASTDVVVSAQPGPPNTPPLADAGGPYAGPAGQPLTFDARGSSDADKDDVACAWSFGDGTIAAGTVVTHQYEAPGTYTVVLLVTDGKGGSDAVARLATIAAAPPAPAQTARPRTQGPPKALEDARPAR